MRTGLGEYVVQGKTVSIGEWEWWGRVGEEKVW